MRVDSLLLLKTIGIFEKISGKKIYLKFDGEPAVHQLSSKSYMIHFPRDTDDPYYYRSLEHEISHILFKSNFSLIKAFIDQAQLEHNLAHGVINTVEDVRVDSLWNAIYPGSHKIRLHQLSHYMAQINRIKNRGLYILTAAYFKAQGLEPQAKFSPEEHEAYLKVVQELNSVKMKGPEATFAVALQILRILRDYFPKRRDAPHKGSKGKQMRFTPPSNMSPDKMKLEALAQEVQDLTWPDDDSVKLTEDHLSRDPTKTDKRLAQELLSMKVEELEKKSEQTGQTLVNAVKKALEELRYERVDLKTKVFGRVKTLDLDRYKWYDPQPNRGVVLGLRRYLASLRLKHKYTLSEEGDEIDIDSYVQHIHDVEKPVFISEGMSEGAYIGILVDYSGSMSGKVVKVLKVLASFEQAVETLPNIEVEYFPFKGDTTCYITKVKKVSDLARISPDEMTPLPTAIMWAGFEVIQKPQPRKFLIILTDGLPEDGEHSRQVLITWTSNAVRYLRRHGVKVFVLFIDPPDKIDVEKVFNADVMVRLDMSRFERSVLTFFSQVVRSVMEV